MIFEIVCGACSIEHSIGLVVEIQTPAVKVLVSCDGTGVFVPEGVTECVNVSTAVGWGCIALAVAIATPAHDVTRDGQQHARVVTAGLN